MKTSTAEKNNYICPKCGDTVTQDNAGKGFVRHISNPFCTFEKGERDQSGGKPSKQSK